MKLENIKSKSEERGLTFVKVLDNNKGAKQGVLLACKKGHKLTYTVDSIRRAKCPFCEGGSYDLPKLIEELEKVRFKLTNTASVDTIVNNHGYKSVVMSKRIEVVCMDCGQIRKGHITPLVKKETRCMKCEGRPLNSGYSRGEEIIAKTLRYNNVNFVRHSETSEKYSSLELDFVLPDLEVIIEYDGTQHKYGRKDNTDRKNKNIFENDKVRNEYANAIGYQMIRITSESYQGKAIITHLGGLFPFLNIDIADPVYDDIVREVYDYTYGAYGWLSYKDLWEIANYYKNHTLKEAMEFGNKSKGKTLDTFKWVYGVNKKDYLKYYGRR